MLPKTKLGEKRHRQRKRQWEVSLAIQAISRSLRPNEHSKINGPFILEFGSGDGFQIPYLQRLGRVFASDIYISEDVKKATDLNFVQCSISNAPFRENQFDLVYSNHVMEHLQDLQSAFKELRRIGKPDCLYAFSVPTNIWLLLSIPAHYYKVARNLVKRLYSMSFRNRTNVVSDHDCAGNHQQKKKTNGNRLYRILFPQGHGATRGFIECYRSFRIKNWRRLFSENRFSIILAAPLLLYGPSEWPVISTTESLKRFGICSSVLFLMKKDDHDQRD